MCVCVCVRVSREGHVPCFHVLARSRYTLRVWGFGCECLVFSSSYEAGVRSDAGQAICPKSPGANIVRTPSFYIYSHAGVDRALSIWENPNIFLDIPHILSTPGWL